MLTFSRQQLIGILFSLLMFIGFLSYEYTIYRHAYQAMILSIFILGVIIIILGTTESNIPFYLKALRNNNIIFVLSSSMLLSTLLSSLTVGLVTYHSLFSVLLIIFTFYIFFLLLPTLLNNLDQKARKLSSLITFFSAIGIIIGMEGNFLGYSPTHYPRVSSIFFDPNYFGTLCAIGFILCMSNKGIYRLFAFINLLALYFSGSRAAMISLFIVVFVFYFHKKKWNKKTLLSFVALCIAGYLSLTFLLNTGYFRFYNGLSSRDYLWELSFNIIKEQPIWGYGHGSVAGVLQNIGASISSSHNAYLDFIITYGYPTFFLYSFVIIKAFYIGAKNNIPQYVLKSAFLLCISANSISINLGGLGITSLLFTLFLGICNASNYKSFSE